MALFYFNTVSDGALIEDLEGTELDNVELARQEAIYDARALMSAAILTGRDISGRSVQILDEQRAVVITVPFSEAFIKEK
jgi:hypothetical protein